MSRFVTIAASYREGSTNQKLVDIAANIAKELGAEITPLAYPELDCPLLKDDGDMPIMPEGAQRFSEAMQQADGLLLSTPEFNWSMPGSLKNLIDWMSLDSHYPLKGKTALLMSATPSLRGGIMGLDHVRSTLSLMGMHVYPQMVGLGNAHEIVTEDTITHPKELRFLQQNVRGIVRMTDKLTAEL